jgi:FtsP/CotA-like multicopper oxidase with cupredoxin domain
VRKRINDAAVRMLAYNGSIPGPTLRVQQGSALTVETTNERDVETTVHWHGLRLENRYDSRSPATSRACSTSTNARK